MFQNCNCSQWFYIKIPWRNTQLCPVGLSTVHRYQSVFFPSQSARSFWVSFSFGSRSGSHLLNLFSKKKKKRLQGKGRWNLCSVSLSRVPWGLGNLSGHPLSKRWYTRIIQVNSLFLFFLFFKMYWSIIDLQCCDNFFCTAKWVSYTCTHIHSFPNSFPT